MNNIEEKKVNDHLESPKENMAKYYNEYDYTYLKPPINV